MRRRRRRDPRAAIRSQRVGHYRLWPGTVMTGKAVRTAVTAFRPSSASNCSDQENLAAVPAGIRLQIPPQPRRFEFATHRQSRIDRQSRQKRSARSARHNHWLYTRPSRGREMSNRSNACCWHSARWPKHLTSMRRRFRQPRWPSPKKSDTSQTAGRKDVASPASDSDACDDGSEWRVPRRLAHPLRYPLATTLTRAFNTGQDDRLSGHSNGTSRSRDSSRLTSALVKGKSTGFVRNISHGFSDRAQQVGLSSDITSDVNNDFSTCSLWEPSPAAWDPAGGAPDARPVVSTVRVCERASVAN